MDWNNLYSMSHTIIGSNNSYLFRNDLKLDDYKVYSIDITIKFGEQKYSESFKFKAEEINTSKEIEIPEDICGIGVKLLVSYDVDSSNYIICGVVNVSPGLLCTIDIGVH